MLTYPPLQALSLRGRIFFIFFVQLAEVAVMYDVFMLPAERRKFSAGDRISDAVYDTSETGHLGRFKDALFLRFASAGEMVPDAGAIFSYGIADCRHHHLLRYIWADPKRCHSILRYRGHRTWQYRTA